MIAEHSGWTLEKGFFCHEYILPESGMVLISPFNETYKQLSGFIEVEADWNNDGDIYTLTVATFERGDIGTTYHTPEYLLDLMINQGYTITGVTRR